MRSCRGSPIKCIIIMSSNISICWIPRIITTCSGYICCPNMYSRCNNIYFRTKITAPPCFSILACWTLSFIPFICRTHSNNFRQSSRIVYWRIIIPSSKHNYTSLTISTVILGKLYWICDIIRWCSATPTIT